MASEKVTALVEEVKGLTVLELSELVHTLEEVFGALEPALLCARGPRGCRGGRRPCEGRRALPRPRVRNRARRLHLQ